MNFGTPRIAEIHNLWHDSNDIKYLSTFDDDFKKRGIYWNAETEIRFIICLHLDIGTTVKSNECLAVEINDSDLNSFNSNLVLLHFV